MTDLSRAEALLAKLSAVEAKQPRLAASILLLRDSANGMEVLMVVRAKEIEFASGAMVYPGGKLMESDKPVGMGDRLRGHEALDSLEVGFRVAAIREAFEEVALIPGGLFGTTPAEDRHIEPINDLRTAIDRGEADFADALRQAGLTLDVGSMVRFAHLIAPVTAPKRFDTPFYATTVTAGQTPQPDGKEIKEARWIRPDDAFAMAKRGECQLMFPTRIVLGRLAQFQTVAAALAAARAEPPQPMMPRLEIRNDQLGLMIDAKPGYPEIWERIETAATGGKMID
jgi:8-oxo-dGTP pyrophosphatase MutT (NUDIX family)